MESYIFSDILMILKTEFMKRNEPIFSYLKDLSNIKRFRAFIMFINNSEKQGMYNCAFSFFTIDLKIIWLEIFLDLKLMLSYCKTVEKIPEKEVTDLQNKYEV